MSKKVEARFQCESRTKSVDGSSVKLNPVTSASDDEGFWRYTPWGSCEMGLVQDDTAAFFEPGATYRVTFERVED